MNELPTDDASTMENSDGVSDDKTTTADTSSLQNALAKLNLNDKNGFTGLLNLSITADKMVETTDKMVAVKASEIEETCVVLEKLTLTHDSENKNSITENSGTRTTEEGTYPDQSDRTQEVEQNPENPQPAAQAPVAAGEDDGDVNSALKPCDDAGT